MMNKQTKVTIFVFLLIFAVSFSAMAADPFPSFKDLQDNAAEFSEGLAKTLPFNASLGLNWSDAFIGKLFPSLPPHFGVGVSLGMTTMDSPIMKTLSGLLNTKLPVSISKMPIPAYTAEARVGGFILPFDIGVKVGYLPEVELFGIGSNYLLVGGDIRYAVLNNAILPKVSIGVGVNYLQGGVFAKMGTDIPGLEFGAGNSISLEKPKVEFTWITKSLDFKAQISKSFLIITPYAGLGASYAWSQAGYSVKAKVNAKVNGQDVEIPDEGIKELNDYIEDQKIDTLKVSKDGISSLIESNSFGLRAFGGISVNLTVFRIDLTVLYSILDNNYGGSLGFRFQL